MAKVTMEDVKEVLIADLERIREEDIEVTDANIDEAQKNDKGSNNDL